ncbi:MAG: hypothetical protein HY700_19425, partial [Gemmatimonadetes bacterium]|nr:hypothetical protein [Gemmatimonadota bacterium]
ADVELRPGSRVGGDLIVVGGGLSQDPAARIVGDVDVDSRRIDIRREGERIELERDIPRSPRRRTDPRRYAPRGRTSILLGAEGTYNRVEGLPYRGGARIDWRGAFNGRIEAVAIARTAEPFDSILDNLGYRVSGRFGFGEDRLFELGASAYDVIKPVEDWQLADDEVGFASFLLRRDYRDYYGQRGVSGYVSVSPSPSFRITGEVARDDERSVAARDPWTLSRRSEPWRPNPGIDEGRFIHFRARLEYHSRGYNRWSDMPRWLFRGEWEVGYSNDVRLQPLPWNVRGPVPERFKYGRVFLDLRRYQPIGSGELRIRALVAGDLPPEGSSALPPMQRRLSLGGPDPLPGYRFGEFTCNDPNAGLSTAACREIALVQVEYRGGLNFSVFDVDRDWARSAGGSGQGWKQFRPDGERTWFDGPELVLFADGGAASGPLPPLLVKVTSSNGLRFDVGAGLEFGSLGVYAARALGGSAPIRFTLRLHQRF